MIDEFVRESDFDWVTISVECDGLVEYTKDVPANIHEIQEELRKVVPWFTGRETEYATALIDQLVEENSIGRFVVETEAHGPVTFTVD